MAHLRRRTATCAWRSAARTGSRAPGRRLTRPCAPRREERRHCGPDFGCGCEGRCGVLPLDLTGIGRLRDEDKEINTKVDTACQIVSEYLGVPLRVQASIPALRQVLAARSAYFKALWSSEFREATAGEVVLEDLRAPAGKGGYPGGRKVACGFGRYVIMILGLHSYVDTSVAIPSGADIPEVPPTHFPAALPRGVGEEQLHALLRFCYADEWVAEVDFAMDMLPVADRCHGLDRTKKGQGNWQVLDLHNAACARFRALSWLSQRFPRCGAVSGRHHINTF